ncbi:permease prefix domain 1-containing protein [Butyrivibrio sp. YAB3001]|uniref:permease prefix domain 1-containing protein n=1 Tax=Butyrivibrio sp. YAB3001 TaxID=1520812 RepID=UPI0008F65A11|nr:permease prefix domain 1-containing protein [Butyrivibrio sp. YAB3001]SFB84981.1 hypothetical protein SAMN02910398_00864 [Butyrivibrio sp. YAB3001]
METLRNYLETMFANLPNSLEVNNAKQELWTMMEDKYNELISEGKTENEAVGTIISEFGNLDEIADAIGIKNVIENYETPDIRMISLQEAKDFVFDSAHRTFMVALAVFFFIISPVGPILGSEFNANMTLFNTFGNLLEAIGVIFMFFAAAIGVGIIIVSSLQMKEWDYIKRTACGIDYSTAEYLAQEKKNNESEKSIMVAIGIILCIASIIPVTFFGILNISQLLTDAIGPSLLFIIAAFGVMLIINAGGKDKAYDCLLNLNSEKTISGNYESTKKAVKRYKNNTKGYISKNYWQAVTCIYLIWSFLTFDWYKTWIIFPIASFLRGFITKNHSKEEIK